MFLVIMTEVPNVPTSPVCRIESGARDPGSGAATNFRISDDSPLLSICRSTYCLKTV